MESTIPSAPTASTASFSRLNGHVEHHDHVLRPRAIKAGKHPVLQTLGEGLIIGPNGIAEMASGGSRSSPTSQAILTHKLSGRSTPVPADAPPSAKSISMARRQIRALQQRRSFPTISYSARVSHFDPTSDYTNFKGFFVLFWIGLAIMVITTMLRNIKDTGLPLRVRPWALFTENFIQLGFSDLFMVLSTAPIVPLQQIFKDSTGLLQWAKLGMPLHSLYEISWLILWINWPFLWNWTWTAQVFFTLHTLVFLMKMHSYAFYNGHLSTTAVRLSALDRPETASTAAAVRYPSSTSGEDVIEKLAESSAKDHNEVAVAGVREDLAFELTSSLGQVTYPQNLTLINFVDYVLCPTLCYELEYPRTAKRQWDQLFWKTLAVFGCIFLMTVISEEFIVPVLSDSAMRLLMALTLAEKGLILAETTSMLLFPFMLNFLLIFLVIFEYILGAFAEITRFADRHFYSDWWNSCDWLEFSREWNIPVHHFLRRHVYSASLPYMSKGGATTVTFLVSAILHELVMGCITKKFRGYGFVSMMLQIPLVGLQRSPWMKDRALFNNICFWISIILGQAVMCSLYVLV